MTGFFYFFEQDNIVDEHNKLNKEVLEELGLFASFGKDRVIGENVIVTRCPGPNGNLGKVVYPQTLDRAVPRSKYIYNGNQQQWIERDGFWIGWDPVNPPNAKALQRTHDLLDGFWVEDDRDRKWLVPVIRSSVGQDALPFDYGFDRGGNLVRHVKPQYKKLWDLAGEVFDYLRSTSVKPEDEADAETIKRELEAKYPDEWVVKTAVTFMGINYRFGIHEAQAMLESWESLLDTRWVTLVLQAACDFPNWVIFTEKKTPNLSPESSTAP